MTANKVEEDAIDLTINGEEEESMETAEKEDSRVCPRCGWSQGKVPEPDEEDLREYLRCVLGGKAFSKEYSLYGGDMKVECRALRSAQVDELNKWLYTLAAMDATKLSVNDFMAKLKALFFISRIDMAGAESMRFEAPVIETFKDIQEIFDARFSSSDEMVLRVISRVMVVFEELQSAVIEKGFDSDFWKGAGLR